MRKNYLYHLCETSSGRNIFLIVSFIGLWIYTPNSEHVKTLGLLNTDDLIIWEYAKANHFVIISKDSDFHQRSLVYGHPPKFIYLRVGNCPTSKIVQILRDNFNIIR